MNTSLELRNESRKTSPNHVQDLSGRTELGKAGSEVEWDLTGEEGTVLHS